MLRQAQHVPGDGRDPFAGIGRHASRRIVREGICVVRPVREAEVRTVGRRTRVLDRTELVTAVGINEIVDQAVGGGAGPAVALQTQDIAVTVILRDVLGKVDGGPGRGLVLGLALRGVPDEVIEEPVLLDPAEVGSPNNMIEISNHEK